MESWKKLSFNYQQIPTLLVSLHPHSLPTHFLMPFFKHLSDAMGGLQELTYISVQIFISFSVLLMITSSIPCLCTSNEPRHDKTNEVTVHPAKTQISLGIRPVWSRSDQILRCLHEEALGL